MKQEKPHKGILPDGKAQVTIEYDGDSQRADHCSTVPQYENNKARRVKSIYKLWLWQCFEDFPFDNETEILLNPSGQFIR